MPNVLISQSFQTWEDLLNFETTAEYSEEVSVKAN